MLAEIFCFRYCGEGQSRHRFERTALSQGLKEMLVEKKEGKTQEIIYTRRDKQDK